jgi:hypothetical protein
VLLASTLMVPLYLCLDQVFDEAGVPNG